MPQDQSWEPIAKELEKVLLKTSYSIKKGERNYNIFGVIIFALLIAIAFFGNAYSSFFQPLKWLKQWFEMIFN